MKTKAELAAIRRRAFGIAFFHLALGGGVMLFSLGEDSFGWTFFIWLAGLEGIAIGLLSGLAYSQVAVGTIPPKWKMTPLAGCFWSLLTFWAPIITTFMFGLMLYTTLPDAALPKSALDGSKGAGTMQSFVTFFNAVGCFWLMVMLVAKKAEQSLDESASDASAVAKS